MTSILFTTGINTARHNLVRTKIYGRTNNFLIKPLNMCAGGMVPLSTLKYAAADSTEMNLKVCALTCTD